MEYWHELVEHVRRDYDRVMEVRLYLTADGRNACEFYLLDNEWFRGSGGTMQEAVGRCMRALLLVYPGEKRKTGTR